MTVSHADIVDKSARRKLTTELNISKGARNAFVAVENSAETDRRQGANLPDQHSQWRTGSHGVFVGSLAECLLRYCTTGWSENTRGGFFLV